MLFSLSGFCQQAESQESFDESNDKGQGKGSMPMGGFHKPTPKIILHDNPAVSNPSFAQEELPLNAMPVLKAKPNTTYHLLNALPKSAAKLHLQIKKP
ncbi:hypothetical protein TH61_14300 [Rufibacter sp. DG15C]|nr:hypothetical protein TH61_14300 [Rufibacter sp. DG15C]